MELVNENDISYMEEKLKISNIKNMKETFLASSIRGIVPIVRINNMIIGDGKPGDNTLFLTKLYKHNKEGYEYCN